MLLLLLPYHSNTSAAEAAQRTVHIHHSVCVFFFHCAFGAEQEAGSWLCGCLLGIVVDHCRESALGTLWGVLAGALQSMGVFFFFFLFEEEAVVYSH